MSRSVKHRTRDGKLTDYVKSIVRFSHKKYLSSEDMAYVQWSIDGYTRKWSNQMQAPREYRRAINASKRARDNMALYNAVKYDTCDDLPSFKWYKDAGYSYF